MPITVAVSTCNRPALLREARTSIAAQTYADWKAALADCPEWRAIKLAVKLLPPRNKYSSPIH